jgi:hypothetical protein
LREALKALAVGRMLYVISLSDALSEGVLTI